MLLFLAGVLLGILLGTGIAWLMVRLATLADHIATLAGIATDHSDRISALERAAEDTAAGVDQVTEDLADLTRRAVAVPPEMAYPEEDDGRDEAPAG